MPDDRLSPERSQDVLSAFLELSPDGVVVVDGRGLITSVNQRACELFGYGEDDLLGQPVDVLVPAARRTAHEGFRTKFQESPHTRPMGAGLALEGARKDGTLFPVDISLTTYAGPDGSGSVIAVVRDMTEQQRRARETSRLAAMVRSSDAAMLSVTPERTIDSWNPGAEVLFGYRPAEIVGKDIMELVPDSQRAEIDALYERVRSGERVELFDARRLSRDGTEIPVAITLSAMRDSRGSFMGWCEVMRDQTERIRIHARLATTEAERQVLADRERIARDLHDVVIQRIFAAGMGLQGLASTMDPSSDLHERLARIIGELDTAVREIRTSIFTIRRRPGDVATVRSQVLDIGAEMTAALGFRPTFDFRGPVDIVVSDGIADSVVAVVREALANIAKHAQAREARVRILADPKTVRVIVSDDGVGMSDTGRRSGVRNMQARAEELGGSFEVETAPGRGTTITWAVPLTGGAPAQR